ncbi:hypothetical protein CWB76_12040 [Pseudoalteromonas sp. S1609]|uniref:DUF6973 domain-containing protein n=1 Tax=Pseudoalteromonas sp. S1609 TaxID=579505 RepID=UPI00110A6F71|nr:hypothetical protein [Pseudoalteromonas sp. S1609]TMP70107.1 hypothetical protein CWB76_12040 [Pseudoalteromonas sp. S1609]
MASSLYDKYDHLTDDEKSYIKTHPHHVTAIMKSRDIAYSETTKRFGHNGRNDKSDAFRHCFWSATLSRDIGYKNALEFTNAHESSPLNIAEEKTMDLHNNSVGLRIGISNSDNTKLSKMCNDALSAGKLKVIKK